MSRLLVVVALLGLAVLWTPHAQAGVIMLSGDGNITTDLLGGGAATAGNRQFFLNVLGSGNRVVIGAGSDIGSPTSFRTETNNFYNAQGGVTSTILNTPVTAADLAGAELFISILPQVNYTAGELATLSSFLSSGGTVFFIGENGNFPSENAIINTGLAALGSGMSIIANSTFDSGFQTATGSQIATDPYTAGVTSFRYAAPSELLVDGGTALFFGHGMQPFIAYEGSGNAAVPEPGSLTLLGFGALGLGAYAWRRRRPANA